MASARSTVLAAAGDGSAGPVARVRDGEGGRGGNDIICGGKGADVLYGPGADRIFGGRDGHVGDDEGTGTWYGNTVIGGLGDDVLSDGPDHDIDWPDYGSTPDRVRFPSATGPITVRSDGTVTGPGIGTRSDLAGGPGGDLLRVAKGLADIELLGGPGADRLDGSRAKRWMVLYGGAGNDVLLGSPGADDAVPGAGETSSPRGPATTPCTAV